MLRTDADTRRPQRPGHPLAVCAALLAALAAGAPASAASSWQPVAAGAPATVRFLDVAAGSIASDPVVVAVGQDTAAPAHAVIYRLARGAWQADRLPAGVSAAKLTQVAIGGGSAYALGASVVLRLANADASGSTAWSSVPAPGGAALTALALSPDGSAGLAGAADGHLYSFAPATGTFTVLNDASGQVVPPNGGITALAAGAPGDGVATAAPSDPDARFFQIGQGQVTPQPALDAAGACGTGALRSAALAGSVTLAVDDTCWWDLENGAWSPHAQDPLFTRSGTKLHDVAAAVSGQDTVAAIVGESGSGSGAAWERVGTGAWTLFESVTPAPLDAVAVVGPAELWAVGDKGAVEHFAPVPVVPPAPTDGGGAAPANDPPPADDPPASNPPPPSDQQSSPQTPPDFTIVIDDPSGRRETTGIEPSYSTAGVSGSSKSSRRPGGKRLLRNVKVRAVKHGLVIEFDLNAPAVVAIAATRGSRSVGRTKPTVFKRGHSRILLRFKGSAPPTNLRIVARRSGKTGASGTPAPGKP